MREWNSFWSGLRHNHSLSSALTQIGKVVVEAISQNPLRQSWQDGYGASSVCSALVSQFALADLQKVANAKGEFFIATFHRTQLLKAYMVKGKHIEKRGP